MSRFYILVHKTIFFLILSSSLSCSLEEDSSLSDLRAYASKQFNVLPSELEFSFGFPRKKIDSPDNQSLQTIGIKSGDRIFAKMTSIPEPKETSPVIADAGDCWACPRCTLIQPITSLVCDACGFENTIGSSSTDTPSSATGNACHCNRRDKSASGDFCSYCHGRIPSPSTHSSSVSTREIKQASASSGPLFLSSIPGAKLKRLLIPSDNSCLFRCIGVVAEQSYYFGEKYRIIAVNAIQNCHTNGFIDPALLEKPLDQYCAWLRKDNSWGGAVECHVLSRVLQIEIVALDIETGNTHFFGQGNGWPRAFVLFDGIHYDVLVGATSQKEELGEDDFREVLFVTFHPEDEAALHEAEELSRNIRKKHQFVNTSTFTLRCNVCYEPLVGQVEAMSHAASTGHRNFVEYVE